MTNDLEITLTRTEGKEEGVTIVALAKIDNRIVGVVAEDEGSEIWWTVNVTPEHQRKGIATRMIQALLASGARAKMLPVTDDGHALMDSLRKTLSPEEYNLISVEM